MLDKWKINRQAGGDLWDHVGIWVGRAILRPSDESTMTSVPTMMKAGKGKGVIQAGRRRARELRRVLHQFHIELGVWPSPVFKTQDQTIIDLDLDRPPKKRYTCYGSELDRGRMESFSCFPENNFAHLFLHLFTLTITEQQSDQTRPGLD